MSVQLTAELEQMIQRKMEAGGYNSASEVVRVALHLMEERDRARAELRAKIAAGMESLRNGEGIDGDALFDEMEAELETLPPHHPS